MVTAKITPVSWAEQSALSSLERDCVTAVTLKILDSKCKMPISQQEAVLAIYDVLHHQQKGTLFKPGASACIEEALQVEHLSKDITEQIHRYRLEAEERIPKPVVKAFKAKLRVELFEKI